MLFIFCNLEAGGCHSFDHKKEATKSTEGRLESEPESTKIIFMQKICEPIHHNMAVVDPNVFLIVAKAANHF